jgi:ABC-type Fe3+-hydroxamate transport system substrate-binding protein
MRRLPAAAAVAAALVLAGCGTTEHADSGDPSPSTSASGPDAGSDSATPAGPVSITDATGASVRLDHPATRVVATEWNVVEDLVTLGVAPVGVADLKGYKAWDTAAPLTNSPKDVGTRAEPSTDTIAALTPDLVVATTDLSPSVIKQLRKVSTVLVIRPADGADQVGLMMKDLDLIARATGTTAKAGTARQAFEAKVAAGRKSIEDAGLGGKEIAFADSYVVSNQVSIRPYTANTLIGAVNTRLGLKNAWKVKGDKDYGLATTDVEGLTGLGADVRFAYIQNGSDGGDPFTRDLAKNAVWKSLPFVKAGQVHRLPDGIWMFGGPASMGAYVDAVVATLTK